MKPIAFEELARVPVVQYYEAAFRKATGVSLKVVPPDAADSLLNFGPEQNPFCALALCAPGGCCRCGDAEGRATRSAAKKLLVQQVYCYAGLTVVAVPVMIGERHVATLLSGQVFRREPTQRDFSMVMKMLGESPGSDWEKKARKAYFETPVVTATEFQSVTHLLSVFAHYLAEFASRNALVSSAAEPAAVSNAKEFVQLHAEEPITLGQVVKHVHVSRFYFCKLFKKATGITLTEYISRVRVEKAKALLANPSMRISEIVYAAGFGSIPRFNAVFKTHVGMAPTEYRASLKSPPPL